MIDPEITTISIYRKDKKKLRAIAIANDLRDLKNHPSMREAGAVSTIDDCEERIREGAYQRGYEEGAKAERERVVDEPHINQYLERIRKSSIALKDEKLKTIISVSLSIAADHYESLRSKERE